MRTTSPPTGAGAEDPFEPLEELEGPPTPVWYELFGAAIEEPFSLAAAGVLAPFDKGCEAGGCKAASRVGAMGADGCGVDDWGVAGLAIPGLV